jgi:hypothetical protein
LKRRPVDAKQSRVRDISEDAIKGAALGEFVRWYAGTRSLDELRQVIAGLPADARSWFDAESPTLGVLASTWYPMFAVHALLDRMTAGMAPAQRQAFATEGGTVIMKRTLSGLYRALFRVISSPDRYPRMAGKVWTQYYRSGRFIVTNEAPGTAISRIMDWTSHHPVLCDMNWAAGRVIYETMGCQAVTVTRDACLDAGDPECRFTMRWRP